MPTVAAASPVTFTLLPSTTVTVAPATTTTNAGQVFNPLHGYRISDPLELPGDPVTASIIRWDATTPADTTLTVETSINYGASWDLATNHRAIPRLRSGDTTTRAVLTRITMTRTVETDPTPTMSHLEVTVTCDSGVYSWEPIAYGVIDKPSVKTTSNGGTGGSSGGAGVTSRGGGQFGGGPAVKVHCVDSSHLIKLAQWEQPFFVPTGITASEAIRLMLADRLPGHDKTSIVSTTRLVEDILIFGLDQGGDPWQDFQEFATANGFECYFDPNDTFVWQPVPDPRYTEPTLVIDQAANPVITEAKSELDLETVINYVVVRGESTSSRNPVVAAVFDDDPSSLTYIGRIEKRVRRYTFPWIKTEEQAEATAKAILYNSLGASNTVELTMMPNPRLQPGMAVKLNVPDVAVAGIYVINQIAPHPISPGQSMRLVCFRQTDNTTTA
jgi:hypothetical protein